MLYAAIVHGAFRVNFDIFVFSSAILFEGICLFVFFQLLFFFFKRPVANNKILIYKKKENLF